MRNLLFATAILATATITTQQLHAQANDADTTGGKHLFIDVHHLQPGKVKYEDVVQAHAKDLATEDKYGVHFIKYWVDEDKGLVYCLSSAKDSASIANTHKDAHGLLPQEVYMVTDGKAAAVKGNNNFYLDVHQLGSVTAKDVATAHQKDLAAEKKYGVNFINYWVNEKEGVVVCLSQAPDSSAVINTHKEAHGLVPVYIAEVKQGQ